MKLSILYVAYPLLAVNDESAGGAEQVLLTVEREMAAAGHRTTVAAADGSSVSGNLLATGPPASTPDRFEARERKHNAHILEYLQDHSGDFDLIHDMSGTFFRQTRECPVPILATLHLPRSFYKPELFDHLPPNLFFNCVSESQARTFRDLPNLVGVVQNGIALQRFPLTREKDNYLLWLGRICEEKGPHLAIAAAHRAKLPLIIAGQVYPFSYHQAYFDREIRPHLANGSPVRFIEAPTFDQKIELLRHARALLLTSTAEETSSLVAMEAMACGTPVLALRRGAFPEILVDGKTGFLVENAEEMSRTLIDVDKVSAAECRHRVERHFTASRMAQEYQKLFREVLTAAEEPAA